MKTPVSRTNDAMHNVQRLAYEAQVAINPPRHLQFASRVAQSPGLLMLSPVVMNSQCSLIKHQLDQSYRQNFQWDAHPTLFASLVMSKHVLGDIGSLEKRNLLAIHQQRVTTHVQCRLQSAQTVQPDNDGRSCV